jgi:serine/tyrosine/threonine adenylyltransferase
MKEMFQLLQNHQPDYSNFFRDLANYQGITDCSIELSSWLDRYLKLCYRESISHIERKKKMDAVNPKYILRNQLVQLALEKALKEGDFSEVTRLGVLLEKPFEDRPELFKKYKIEADFYSQDTPQEFFGRQTSCST